MSISVGDELPEANFAVMTSGGPAGKSTSEVFAGKKVAVFAVPGAFTPTCHLKHLPGFLDHLNDFKDRGVDTVACISVNDIFVLDAWARNAGAEDKILFLADGNCEFTIAIGLEFDASTVGLGERSKRYAMLVDDGVVKVLNVEDAPASAIISSADELLKSL
jgi:peroxiredoxin